MFFEFLMTMTQRTLLDTVSPPVAAGGQRDATGLTQQHPEWFSDYDGVIPFEEIGDLSLRAEERLVFLQKQIKSNIKRISWH